MFVNPTGRNGSLKSLVQGCPEPNRYPFAYDLGPNSLPMENDFPYDVPATKHHTLVASSDKKRGKKMYIFPSIFLEQPFKSIIQRFLSTSITVFLTPFYTPTRQLHSLPPFPWSKITILRKILLCWGTHVHSTLGSALPLGDVQDFLGKTYHRPGLTG